MFSRLNEIKNAAAAAVENVIRKASPTSTLDAIPDPWDDDVVTGAVGTATASGGFAPKRWVHNRIDDLQGAIYNQMAKGDPKRVEKELNRLEQIYENQAPPESIVDLLNTQRAMHTMDTASMLPNALRFAGRTATNKWVLGGGTAIGGIYGLSQIDRSNKQANLQAAGVPPEEAEVIANKMVQDQYARMQAEIEAQMQAQQMQQMQQMQPGGSL